LEADFWHNRWETNKIGWHLLDTNELLIKHIDKLNLKPNSRIFVPLCGKSLDIKWLLENGYNVVGVELNQSAVKQLFESLNIEFKIKTIESFTIFSAKNIDIFVGDIFDLDSSILGKIDAVYDRASIVALSKEYRKKYTTIMPIITNKTPQLIITIEYDQNLVKGPPFCVDESFFKEHYSKDYYFEILESIQVNDFKAPNCKEIVWLAKPSTLE
jgi:thiopurine S-methyltransferase